MPSTPVASRKLLILLLTLAVMAFVGAAGAGPLGAIAAPDKVMADEKEQPQTEEQSTLDDDPKAETHRRSAPMPKLRPAGKVKAERPARIQSRPASADPSGTEDEGRTGGHSEGPADPPEGKPDNDDPGRGHEDDDDEPDQEDDDSGHGDDDSRDDDSGQDDSGHDDSGHDDSGHGDSGH